MDDLGGLGHHSSVLGLDHLDHHAFLGLRDGVAVAAAGAVSAAAAVSAGAVSAAVSGGQTAGVSAGVAAVTAARTFHGITSVARCRDGTRDVKQAHRDSLILVTREERRNTYCSVLRC